MLWHFLQHDEKTKKIGKQRGNKGTTLYDQVANQS
jgi:hypothetical protein